MIFPNCDWLDENNENNMILLSLTTQNETIG